MNIDNLTIIDEGDKFLFAICPFPEHEDTEPSLCINKIPNNGRPKGYWFCFGCNKFGQISEEKVDSLCKKPSNYREDDVKSDYVPIDWAKWIDENEETFWNYDDKFGYPFNVHHIVLQDLNCGWWMSAYTFPFRNENNEITGIQLRYLNGKKRCIEGSKLGLFIPQGVDWSKQDTVFITEGVSDLAILLDLGFVGIARPSANSCNDIVYKWLKNNYAGKWPSITIIADNDVVGIEGARDLRNYIDDDYKDVGILRFDEAKDLREWIQKKGKDFVKKELEKLI